MVSSFTPTDDYAERIRKLFPSTNGYNEQTARNVTFQVTGSCNLRCSYCYEHCKSCSVMTLDTGKKIIDYLLDLYERNEGDFITHRTKALVLDFIGGEPLLEANLIEQICDYFYEQCWLRKNPLAVLSRISFTTNGQAWFTPEAQHLIKKYHDIISVTVSIDGIQELHDAFRVDVNGVGSFSKAYAAFQDAKKYGWYNSKMTFVPDSVKYIYPSVKMMINEGCKIIHCNFAYEPVYTKEDASNIYFALKELSDWLIENKSDVYITMLNDDTGHPVSPNDNSNYCGGTGSMLSFAPDGKAYPCIRYAPISVGKEKAAPMCLGNCFDGLYKTKHQQDTKIMLDAITRESQSTKECFECPVAMGCGGCSGYNYECFGTPNHRSTNICLAHKGRVLASYYYANKRFVELGDVEPRVIYMPYNEVVDILDEKSAAELFELQKAAAIKMRKEE